MKWFTCIIHMPSHVSPVQHFCTRADDATDAVIHAHKWMIDGDPKWTPEDIDVPFVFDGRIERNAVDWDAVNAAIGWKEPESKPIPDQASALREAMKEKK